MPQSIHLGKGGDDLTVREASEMFHIDEKEVRKIIKIMYFQENYVQIGKHIL